MKTVKVLSFFLPLLLCSALSSGQTLNDAELLFKHGQLDSAIAVAKKFMNPDNPDAYVMIGRILVAQEKYAEAKEYLIKAETNENAPAFAKAWSMYELGICYFMLGDAKKSRENINGCIELNATDNFTTSAKKFAILAGLDKIYEPWMIKETPHFVFHFQDTTRINLPKFLRNKEAAFDSISGFFLATLPKKIDYFVWSDTGQAATVFKRKLAFTKPSYCVTHTDANHTIGHEMTHCISRFAGPVKNTNPLISEGVAVYFDFSNKNNSELLRQNLKLKNLDLSIKDIWKNKSTSDEAIIYPLGGELIKRLIQKFGREKFMKLFSDQSFESAEKIYGMELNMLISDLEKEVKGQ